MPSAIDGPERTQAPGPPRIGLPTAWHDPEDERIWSRTLANLRKELAQLGAGGGFTDVTPWPGAVRVVHRWLRATGRGHGAWQLRPEMRAVSAAYNARMRRRHGSDVDTWLIPLSSLGLTVSGRFLTWCEMSPTQLLEAWPEHGRSFGYPGTTAGGMRALVRSQRRVIQRAGACCVASSWAGQAMVEKDSVPPGKVRVTGYGRNLEVSPPEGRDWSRPRFLFVGLDWTRKNGDAVVRAFAELRRSRPEAELHVEGGHPRLDVPGVVTHGRLDFDHPEGRAELEHLFRSATCLVVPSAIEPFGLVYVEAAAAGVASIGTNVGGTETSIGDGGIRVQPGDHAALLAAMGRMADPHTAAEYGARALARSKSFSWRQTAERVVRAADPIYADALGLEEFLPMTPATG